MKRYRYIIVIFITSILFPQIFRAVDVDEIVVRAIVQLVGSFILGYVYTQFHLKYRSISFMKVWNIFYGIILGISMLGIIWN